MIDDSRPPGPSSGRASTARPWDTCSSLFLAGPVGNKGSIIQCAGRTLRSCPGNSTAEIPRLPRSGPPPRSRHPLPRVHPGYTTLGFRALATSRTHHASSMASVRRTGSSAQSQPCGRADSQPCQIGRDQDAHALERQSHSVTYRWPRASRVIRRSGRFVSAGAPQSRPRITGRSGRHRRTGRNGIAGGRSCWSCPSRRRISKPEPIMRPRGSFGPSRQVTAARCGHVVSYRTRRAVPYVRPLPEGPPWCELNSGGAAARLRVARDA